MKICLILKIRNYLRITFWNIIIPCIFVLSACGDLVKESESAACKNAIDARNYDQALSTCTSRKDRASAYMGKAGYDIINLLKSSKSTVSAFTKPTNAELGTDDVAGGAILNILQLSVDSIADDAARAEAVTKSRIYLDNATSLLQPHLNDNSSPLSKDELLLNTFAISFAMQLNQLEIFDNATTSTETFPEPDGGSGVDNLTCAPIVISDSDAQAKLIAMDGHLWEKERNGMQCARVLDAIKEASDNATAVSNFNTWVSNGGTGALPEPLATTVCGPIGALTVYLSNLALNLAKLGDILDNNTNTKPISDADNSTNELMRTIGCPTS